MNTFWLKIAGGALVLFIVLIVGARFLPSDDKPKQRPVPEPTVEQEPETKDIYQMAEEDKKKFSVPSETAPLTEPVVTETPPTPPQQPEPSPAPQSPPPPTVIYVKPLGEIEKIQAERLLNAAIPGRTMGRMRVGYNLMTQNCKQIINDYPDSLYAYQAKLVLADIPERYRRVYKLTDQLLDVRRFYTPRRGTQALQLSTSQ